MIILTRKKQNEILKRICANEIIFRHAMNSLPSCDEWCDMMKHYVDNSCDIALIVDGFGGLEKIKNTLERREQGNEQMEQPNK